MGRGANLRKVETYFIKSDATPYNSDTGFRSGQPMVIVNASTVTAKSAHSVPSAGIVVDDVEGVFTSGEKMIQVCSDGDIPVTVSGAIAVNKFVQCNLTTGKYAEFTPSVPGDSGAWVDGYLLEASGADGDKVLMRINQQYVSYTA